MNSNILTFLRIRKGEKNASCAYNSIVYNDKSYVFDNIFHGSSQEDIFSHISRNILSKCILGYNCSVFAYGQTGSGKTYTIQGTESNPGLVQRSLSFLHNNFDEIKLSFIEIYNENMFDLHDPSNEINIREDPIDGVTVDNLYVCTSTSLEQSLDFYKRGISNRKTAETQMNESSSRSHSVFTVQIEIKNKNIIRRSKLCFVDLAGSEKVSEQELQRVKETCNINKSLLCLGKIVHKLSQNDKWHISYRDSKLTFLLKDSLGGNCKLAIIGTVNLDHQADTINTLNFLNRSKMISNIPSVNYDITGTTVEELAENIKVLDEKNQQLENEVAELRLLKENRLYGSSIFEFNKIRREFYEIVKEFERTREIVKEVIEKYYKDKSQEIIELNHKLKEINNENRKNIKEMFTKKRRIEDD